MKKFALVLSGGGFKGAFQLGALDYLRQNWSSIDPPHTQMKFDIIAGVSVGSLNGVLTAANEFDELKKLWDEVAADIEKIYTSDFIDTKNQTDTVKFNIDLNRLMEKFLPGFKLKLSFLDMAGMVFGGKGQRKKIIGKLLAKAGKEFTANFSNFKSIASNSPLHSKLKNLVKISKIKDCVYKCGFVSLDNGEYYSVRHDEFHSDTDFQNGILASTAMPIVWDPVESIRFRDIDARCSVDGGIRNVSPLADVITEINNDPSTDDYTIIIINCNSGDVNAENYAHSNIAGIALRSLNDISITEIFNNDLAEFIRINDLIIQMRSNGYEAPVYNFDYRAGKRSTKALKSFKAIIIQPDNNVLGDTLIANRNIIDRRIQHGWQKAEKALMVYKNSGSDFNFAIV